MGINLKINGHMTWRSKLMDEIRKENKLELSGLLEICKKAWGEE